MHASTGIIDLSIIIVTYNPGDILLQCLASLTTGIGKLTAEIVVIDNCSSDGIVHAARTQFPDVKFVINDENRGFAGANNQGLQLCSGQYVVLLNPDVVVQPNSLFVLVDYLRQYASVGIVGPRTLDAVGNVSLTGNVNYVPLTILWQYVGLDRFFPHHVYGRFRKSVQNATEPFEVAWVQGCCLLMRREVYDEIGGLDEGFFLFAEEPDFCERAFSAGWKTVFVPAAVISHLESNSVSRYPERKIRNYHISPLYYFRKRGKENQIRILKVGFIVELGLKMGARLLNSLSRRESSNYIGIYRRVLAEVLRY